MATEFDNIGSLKLLPSALTGREVIEALSDAVAKVGGAPNALISIDQIKAYCAGLTGVQTIAGTAYTAQQTDAAQYTRFTNGAPVAFTIPPSSVVPWTIGTELAFEQAGAGAVTPTAGVGVTILSRGGASHTAGQYAPATLKYVAVDTWVLSGDIA